MGTGSVLVGGAGALSAILAGASDTVLGGGGATAVTLSGSKAVVAGSIAGLAVLDEGASDTIDAGVSSTSVTAPGGSFVRGGPGPLNFVGGSGPSTIIGGSGNATVFGGSGPTSIFGGAGGAITYVNSVAGGLHYVAGSGSETIDASLSKGQGVNSVIIGGADSAGHNLLIAGQGDQYISAGSGSDTLVGGNGVTTFYFNSANGGPNANDFISNFSAIDLVVLQNYGPFAAAVAIAGATTAGNSTTLTLSDSTKITFVGVTSPAALNDHVFST
jgi:Ca2+-binding RTX toxin-like protein